MKIIKLEKVKEKTIINTIKKGKIFIYPTDTIYGLGCNALDYDAVMKVRRIKLSTKPFSVIAPSKPWIYKNFEVKKQYIQKLPGPFTFILKMKNKVVAKNVNNGKETLGIRIPKHKFTRIIQKSKLPFVTTSVNKSRRKPITDIKKINEDILKKVDFIIDDGILDNKPSTIIDLTSDVAKIIR